MKILQVRFDYPFLFKKRQTIDFDNKNLCFVGENGAGKTTTLRILEKIFRGRNYGYDFDLKAVDYEVDIELSQDEYEIYFKNVKYSKENAVFTISNGDRRRDIEISSKVFSKEFDLIKEKVEILYEEYKKLFLLYSEKYIEFSKSVPFSYERRPLVLGPKRVYDLCFDYVLNKKEKFIKDDKLDMDGNAHADFYLSGKRLLHFNFGDQGTIREEFGDFFEYFKEYIKTGTPIIDDEIKKFRETHQEEEDEILRIISKIDEQGKILNNLFGRWDGFNRYIERKFFRNVVFLTASDNPSKDIEDFLFKIVVQLNSNDYYSSIIGGYKKRLKNRDYDEQLLTSMLDLEVFKEAEFNEDSFTVNDAISYIEQNMEKCIELTEEAIFKRNIYQDFKNGFAGLAYCITEKGLCSDVRKFLLNNLPLFDQENVNDIIFEFEEAKPKIFFVENESEKKIELSQTSTGRNWGLIFKAVLSTLDEDSIFIVDEPGAFLHLSAQRDVVKELYNQECIVAYSTHAPTLLPESLQEASIHSIGNDEHRSIKKLDKYDIDELADIFSLNFAKYLIIKRFSRVILVPTKLTDKFDRYLKKGRIINDIEFIPVYENPDVLSRTVDFLESIHMDYYMCLTNEKFDDLKNTYINKCFSITNLKNWVTNCKTNKLSSLLEVNLSE